MALMAIGTTIIATLFGLLFYSLRCRRPLYYGVIEVVASLVTIFLSSYPTTHILIDKEPPWWSAWLGSGLGLLVGIYIMVRGLDNIEKGLPPKYRGSWDRLFSGR